MSGFGAITLRAMPPFVVLSEKEKRKFCLNHVIPLKSLKPEYLDQSSNWFSKCERPVIEEPMAITKPAVPVCTAFMPGFNTIYQQQLPHVQ